MRGPGLVGYLPIATTVIAIAFAARLFVRYRERGGTHHVWWIVGMLTYAAGTLTESLTTLIGWHEPIFRAWYITGALLGGAPLAQGTVYLLMKRRTANRLTVAVGTVVIVAAVCVILSPINYGGVEPYRLTGRVLEWHWWRRLHEIRSHRSSLRHRADRIDVHLRRLLLQHCASDCRITCGDSRIAPAK